jgi:hypothetical protein
MRNLAMAPVLAQESVLVDCLAVLYLLFVGTAILLGWRWRYRRAESRLRQWAERFDYHIVDRSYRLFRRGSFYWTSSGNQDVFRIVVVDGAGNRRSGWVRFGDWWWGNWSLDRDNADVLWDENDHVVLSE